MKPLMDQGTEVHSNGLGSINSGLTNAFQISSCTELDQSIARSPFAPYTGNWLKVEDNHTTYDSNFIIPYSLPKK